MFGKHHSDEHKKKVSESLRGRVSPLIGRKLSEETKRKMREAHLGEKNHFYGRKHTDESKRKNGVAHLRENLSQETLQKMSIANSGRTISTETRNKIAEANRKRKYNPHSLEAKEKNRQAHLGKIPHNKGKPHPNWIGTNNPNWKGGVTPINLQIRRSLEYKIWRRNVFERDNYTCQMCLKRGFKINADHIKSFAEFPELRFELSNGRTLCEPCHRNTPNYGKRKPA